jgi:glycosyltransferase involved in cell wall biosynthesis
MNISYSVTVCSEIEEIQKLLPFMLDHKRDDDEVVIVLDSKNGSDEVRDYLFHHTHSLDFHQYNYEFDGDFSALKNFAKSKCSGDYIIALDADEIPHETLITQLPQIIEMNDVDLIWVPRVNTVDGITGDHIHKWGWVMSDQGWVNYPDYQSRIYKNIEYIKWEGKVHETVKGATSYAHLPPHEELSLYHHKTIRKQEIQNTLYEQLT